MTTVAYISGWCGSAGHGKCLGTYARIDCTCDCHRQPPLITARCFFGCDHTAEDPDPWVAHNAMEQHYFLAHRADIRAAIGWVAPR